MSVAPSDIRFRLSGGSSNTSPAASLGGVKSSTEIVNSVDNNLFDDVTSAEHLSGDTEYRCFYVHNANGSTTLTSAVAWIASDTISADTDLAIAVGTAAVNGTEQTIANENTAPTGVTWSNVAIDRPSGLPLGNLPAGQHKAVWLRRIVTTGSVPQVGDTAQIAVGGDTT